MFRQKFKNNVKNEFIRDKRKINNLKILMKITIDFDDWLYEQIMKRKYSKRHSKKTENYINNQIYKNKMNSTRNNRKYDHSKTIFMKFNLTMFWKFKQKKQKKCILHMWQKNHFAKNYESKNVVRWQFNVTLKKKFKIQKKNKKVSITKQLKFHQLILKMKNFTKSTNRKIFKTFEIKKKQNSNSTTAQINTAINDFDIDKFIF